MWQEVLFAGQPQLVNDLVDRWVANPITAGPKMKIEKNARLRGTQKSEHFAHDDGDWNNPLLACLENQGVRIGEKFVAVSHITGQPAALACIFFIRVLCSICHKKPSSAANQ